MSDPWIEVRIIRDICSPLGLRMVSINDRHLAFIFRTPGGSWLAEPLGDFRREIAEILADNMEEACYHVLMEYGVPEDEIESLMELLDESKGSSFNYEYQAPPHPGLEHKLADDRERIRCFSGGDYSSGY